MCGIAGVLSPNKSENKKNTLKMAERLQHRGPDETGIFVDDYLGMVNTRLAIIDIKSGSQPFKSKNENIIVIQNGEIYNYLEVKQKLISLGLLFETESDTEVILKAYEYYDDKFVHLLNGMFTIAIYDKNKKTLALYRDRLGVKPLYIYTNKSTVSFSSEIKAFYGLGNFNKKINNQAIYDYLTFGYVPIPNTMFKYVQHIPPGNVATINLVSRDVKITPYWELSKIQTKNGLSEVGLLDKIDTLLTDATKIRLRSDVELGAFLSGGLDSSIVCALSKKILQTTFKTFSIGFEDKRFDESKYFKKVAKQLELENYEFKLDPDIISLWKKTTYFCDQPHSDISFIPTYILSLHAGKKLKVVLTGDGGDELFGGYSKYKNISAEKNSLVNYFKTQSLFSDKMNLKDIITNEFKTKIKDGNPLKIFLNCTDKIKTNDNINKALYFDTIHLLSGNNLVKPDKMAMAHSLETRSPFLDYRLYELLINIPGSLKLKNDEEKYLLKKVSEKYLSDEIIYRKKQMFVVPVGEWFKNKLKRYLKDVLESKSFTNRNIIKREIISKMIQDHINEKINYTRELRALINLELWFTIFIDEQKEILKLYHSKSKNE